MSRQASRLPRAERRTAPKPARVPRATDVALFVDHGDRPTYSSDEGLA
jgi:hypothetical protein